MPKRSTRTQSISTEDGPEEQRSGACYKPERFNSVKKEDEESIANNDHVVLCPRCRAFDVKPVLDTALRIPEHGIQITPLGKPRSRDYRTNCPLCNLFLSVATTYKRHYDLELRLFDRIPTADGSDESRVSAVEDRFLAVVRRNERLIYDARIVHEIGPNGLLVVSTERKTASCCVRPVNPLGVDYDLVKGWLEDCIKNHAQSCHPVDTDEAKVQIHVIDCWDATIKRLPPLEQYITLSYVWGQGSNSVRFDALETDNTAGLSIPTSKIPRTIRDAMELVKNIGWRYLWVDRYCIPHTDASRRAEAILNMNQIYAGAVVTIVALHGRTAEAGLPGVTGTPRQGNQIVAVGSNILISTLSPLTSIIRKSTWSTRGWTFQEARLSRRCLFLSQQQVYFSCQVGTFSEAVPGQSSCSPVARHLNSSGLDPSMFSPGSNISFSGLFLDRLSYTQRALTYQNDGLDAFRGILRTYPFVTFWGIPVSYKGGALDPRVCFTMGLLWARRSLATFEAHMPSNHTGSYARRPGFPTWSWAGVVGEIFQFATNEPCTYRAFFRSEPENESSELIPAFKVSTKDSGLELRDAIKCATTDMLPELSPALLIEGDLVRVRRESNQSVKAGKVGHIRFRFCDKDDKIMSAVYILPRIDLDEDDKDSSDAQDALVLIDWRDGCRKAQRRFILMLLKWVEEGVAERVGLLGRYYEKWNKVFLENLWRRRVKFELR